MSQRFYPYTHEARLCEHIHCTNERSGGMLSMMPFGVIFMRRKKR